MAVVFHCSSLITPAKQNQSGISSWHQLFSKKFNFEGDPTMLPYNRKNLILSSPGAVSALSKVYGIFSEETSTNQLQDRINMKNCTHMSPPLSFNNFRTLFVNQEASFVRFPAVAVLFTNAMFLAMPLEALAETSETVNSVFNMPLFLFVALIGATVGVGIVLYSCSLFPRKLLFDMAQQSCGVADILSIRLLARQRRGELQRLNEQLRQINAALRRQAKIESYAPSLSYAPVNNRVSESEVIVDPKKEELISRLKAGKNYLRNQDPEKAFTEFKVALELAQNLSDPIEEKKAARGLGASLQRLGKYREAIRYHNMVLGISKRVGESSGNAEAYGAIADCYTELGDLEKAGKFYDKYIARLED